MKLIHYLYNDSEEIGILDKLNIYYLGIKDIEELIKNYTIENLNNINKEVLELRSINDIKPLSFISKPKQDIICIGMNYRAHKEECRKEKIDNSKEFVSVYFSKRCNKINTTGDFIKLHSNITNEVDFEGELGVITYKQLKVDVTDDDIDDSILGYVIMNDVTARDLAKGHQQFYFGKSLDSFAIMSSILVTKDEFDLDNAYIETYLNDKLMQFDYVKNMIFNIHYIFKELASGITLEPLTILSTGTPAGSIMGLERKEFLKENDKVRVEINGIGFIENICKN